MRVRLHVQASVPHIDMHARLCDVPPRPVDQHLRRGLVRSKDNGLSLEVKADELATRTFTVKLRSGTVPRGERVARRPVAAPPVDGQHGWPR